ncbi:DUF2512 family protein [Xylanibacillus composti]|uniref:DUF2512 family protein n=1 Tax=Xylanibacillus composti TaxID=1572762 RepID=A0A8J4M1Y1_9BACL|nr:DUF2512 family protein [Xylanibacillus composti]MDT9724304.1 DUF2512 family protein [Xylanibacillus composti]GIQ69300.1 hypothetical protein XYCOK13_21240 [Xylanibacillus composti]
MGKFMIKAVLNGIVAIFMLMWLSNASFIGALVTAIILCVLAYLVGDQIVLRLTNNTVATIADFGLAFIVLWIAADLNDWTLTFGEIALISLVLALVEIGFHRYLGNTDGRSAS